MKAHNAFDVPLVILLKFYLETDENGRIKESVRINVLLVIPLALNLNTDKNGRI